MNRSLLARLAAAVALVLGTIGVATVGTSGAAPSNVYVVHGIPGVTVDVYVNNDFGAPALPGFAPGDVAGPLSLDAATYNIKVFAAGADPNVDAPVIDKDLAVPGDANISVVANVGSGTPDLTPFVNDVSPTEAGNGRVTVRHTAQAPTVDIQVDGADALPGLAAGAEVLAELPAGTYPVGVQVAPDGPVVLGPTDLPVTAGTNTIVYAVGSADPASNFPLGLVVQTLQVGEQAPAPTPTTPPTTAAPAPTTPAPAPVMAQPRMTG